MKLGVDFGTTRIVISAVDRGNYPLVSFEVPDGSSADWYPSLVGVSGAERRYGWNAWQAQTESGWTIIRSIKRLLEDAGPRTTITLGDAHVCLHELLHGLAADLKSALLTQSNLNCGPGETFEIVLGVPAHANSNQRFLTVEAFRSAGFHVTGVLNEPSAASIEFGHRERSGKSGRESMLVYDLGGGTFDASLVRLEGHIHHVVASEGIPSIGGDEFDHILADLALDHAGIASAARDAITSAQWFRLLDECRVKKEALNPNSRRIVIDLEEVNPDWQPVQIPVADFYQAARPLVEETMAATEDLLTAHGQGEFDILYLTGGGSELPLIARVLRERFGRRVRRSSYTRSATAIGLAIQADRPEAYRLNDQLSRYFGVWREAESGRVVVFDALFEKGMHLPSTGQPPIEILREYFPIHNIGHFRFLECSHRAPDGSPSGDIAIWDAIRFPFDPQLAAAQTDLDQAPVTFSEAAAQQRIRELYRCDASGSITVTISNQTADYSRTLRLGRWSQEDKPVQLVRRRHKADKANAQAT